MISSSIGPTVGRSRIQTSKPATFTEQEWPHAKTRFLFQLPRIPHRKSQCLKPLPTWPLLRTSRNDLLSPPPLSLRRNISTRFGSLSNHHAARAVASRQACELIKPPTVLFPTGAINS